MENERRNGCYRIRLKKTVAGKEKREDFDMIAFLNWLDGVLWGVPLIALMILTGLYFTVRSGFFQFRHFGWIMKRTGGCLLYTSDAADD